jgi:sugar fermentation stimulation protein A
VSIDARPAFAWINTPQDAQFIRRLNRFACLVTIDGCECKVHIPNSGRLEELLIPGAPVIVEKRRNQGKTLHDMLLIQTKGFDSGDPLWVVCDSRLPPKLLRWALEKDLLQISATNAQVTMEPRLPDGRLDLRVQTSGEDHWIETKSVNLLDRHGLARFPDAPTARGLKHVLALQQMLGGAVHGWLYFIVMRADAVGFAPFAERDPDLAAALLTAQDNGLHIRALQFDAGPKLHFMGELPVILPPPTFPGYWPSDSP